MSGVGQQTTVVTTSSHVEHRVVDGSVIPPNIILNNCPVVHIGPKYVHNNNVTINNGVHSVEDTDSVNDGVTAKSFSSVIYKCVSVPFGVYLKILLCGSSFILAILIVVFVALMVTQERPRPDLQLNNEDYPLNKRFVTREAWGAAPPCHELDDNTIPAELVIFIHTASSGTCNNFAACKLEVLNIQRLHMKDCVDSPSNLVDIGYNFLIGSDGHIFVGRGWDKMGSHTRGSNNGSIGVAFIGDFRRDEPSPLMLNSAKTLLEVGIKRSKLVKDYQLVGHCQRNLKFPESPGVNILKHIQSWPHWNSTNVNRCDGFVPSASPS